jgi:hypothetical protein
MNLKKLFKQLPRKVTILRNTVRHTADTLFSQI